MAHITLVSGTRFRFTGGIRVFEITSMGGSTRHTGQTIFFREYGVYTLPRNGQSMARSTFDDKLRDGILVLVTA